jgi:hypothetical protein
MTSNRCETATKPASAVPHEDAGFDGGAVERAVRAAGIPTPWVVGMIPAIIIINISHCKTVMGIGVWGMMFEWVWDDK